MLGIKEMGKHQDFPSKNFSLTVPKNFVGQLCCAVFQKFSGSENFMNKGAGGVSRFSVEKFFSHSAEKIRRGIFYCFINFRYRKMLGIKQGRGDAGRESRFSADNFLSHSGEFFVAQPLCAVFQKLSVSENFINKGGGGVSRFSVEKFFSHSA